VKKTLTVFKIIVILGGLLAAVYFIKTSLDNRNRAAFSGPSLSLNPARLTAPVGQTFSVGIILDTATDSVTATELHLSYDPTAIEIINFTNGTTFPSVLPPGESHGNGAFSVILGNYSPFKGAVILCTLKIKILSLKSSAINFTSDTQIAAIDKNGNPLPGNVLAGTTGAIINPAIASPTPTIKPTGTPKPTNTPIPTPTDIPGDTSSILNYQVALANINPDSAQCVVNWPLQFIVLGNGQSNVYSNVIAPNINKVGNQLVFSGSLKLTGFKKTSRVAVFIKGPKHLQMKYGKNQQIGAYGKAGGEITLTNDATTSPVYDFTKHPIIAGDIVGINPEKPDGWINGVDFSYVKSKSLIHETITAGGYLKGDLDGNCQVNSNDVNILKISLQARQGQLY